MINANAIATLEALLREAEWLLAHHDGIHNMHGCCSAVRQWLKNAREGMTVDWTNVDLMIRQMRSCHANVGIWKELEPV